MATDPKRYQQQLNQIPTDTPGVTSPPRLRSAIPEWASDNELGRNAWNTAHALAPVGGLRVAASGVSMTPKAASNINRAIAGTAAVSGGVVGAGALGDTPAAPAANRRPAPGTPAAPGPARPAPTLANNVTRDGNSYSGTNIRDGFTINGFAPGAGLGRGSVVSAQNMAAADNLAASQDAESRARVMAAAPQPSQSARLRDFAMAQLNSGQLGARRNAREMLQAADNMDRVEASRYATDSSLRGTIYSSDAQERSNRANNAAAVAKAQAEARDKGLERERKNVEGARERFAVFGADGKVDQQGTQAFLREANKIVPGYTTMSEAEQARYEPQLLALHEVFTKGRGQQETGILNSIFNDNVQLDSMPNYQGGTLRRQGLTGLLPGQAGYGGYVVDTPDGRTIKLGKIQSENTLRALRDNIDNGGF